MNNGSYQRNKRLRRKSCKTADSNRCMGIQTGQCSEVILVHWWSTQQQIIAVMCRHAQNVICRKALIRLRYFAAASFGEWRGNALKTAGGASFPWVQIPPSPPNLERQKPVIKDQQYPNQDLKHAEKIDIVIVVDMLLTGFDSNRGQIWDTNPQQVTIRPSLPKGVLLIGQVGNAAFAGITTGGCTVYGYTRPDVTLDLQPIIGAIAAECATHARIKVAATTAMRDQRTRAAICSTAGIRINRAAGARGAGG